MKFSGKDLIQHRTFAMGWWEKSLHMWVIIKGVFVCIIAYMNWVHTNLYHKLVKIWVLKVKNKKWEQSYLPIFEN